MSFYPQLECNVTLKKENQLDLNTCDTIVVIFVHQAVQKIYNIVSSICEITIYKIHKFIENVHMQKTVKYNLHWLPWQDITSTSTITDIHSTTADTRIRPPHQLCKQCQMWVIFVPTHVLMQHGVSVCLCVGHVGEPS